MIRKLFVKQKAKQSSPKNKQQQKQVYSSQRLCYKYALAVFFFFGFQGIVANAGALEILWPDLPSPVSFAHGRAIHLNLSIFWPLLGIMGGIYYFFSQEAGREIHSQKLINFNFWLLFFTLWGILGALALGFNRGREYLEAVSPFDYFVVIILILLLYNLFRTYLRARFWTRATLVSIMAGSVTLLLLYLPNLFFFSHQTVDEIFKFWVVHLWEEMSLELIGIGVQAALLIKVMGVKRKTIDAIIYFDLILIGLTGTLATGHHYYWIGLPAYWLWVGGFFSAVQVVPTFLLLYTTLKAAKELNKFSKLDKREKITMALVASSVLYHISGAGLLGFFMAIPSINKYVHGTYLTSSHSHLALFGVFGMLVLALVFYIFFTEIKLTQGDYTLAWIAVLVLNAGLLIMGTALLIAGGLQAYLWRLVGLSFTETSQLIRPYLVLRFLGGLVYALGSTLLTWIVFKNAWQNKQVLWARRS